MNITKAAMECLGTPFHHQGRIKGVGMDCVGLLVYVFRALELPHEDTGNYARQPFDGMLQKNLDQQPSLRAVPKAEMQEGDLLLMRVVRAPQHLAFLGPYTQGCHSIIHAAEQYGGVSHHRLDSLNQAKIVKVYRLERPQ